MPDPHFLLPRGVYRAPLLGPHHETVLVAVTQDHRQFDRVMVPAGNNPFFAMDELWDRLDTDDPVPESPQALPVAS